MNVALPAIQQDLGFSQGNLTQVVNAFLITFGSLLLLTGRIGYFVGRKRVFLAGLVTLIWPRRCWTGSVSAPDRWWLRGSSRASVLLLKPR